MQYQSALSDVLSWVHLSCHYSQHFRFAASVMFLAGKLKEGVGKRTSDVNQNSAKCEVVGYGCL